LIVIITANIEIAIITSIRVKPLLARAFLKRLDGSLVITLKVV
jgi:hypothetical protein